MTQQKLSVFTWSIADLLRGDFKQSEDGRVMLPFTVLRRLNCVLEPYKAAILAEEEKQKAAGLCYLGHRHPTARRHPSGLLQQHLSETVAGTPGWCSANAQPPFAVTRHNQEVTSPGSVPATFHTNPPVPAGCPSTRPECGRIRVFSADEVGFLRRQFLQGVVGQGQFGEIHLLDIPAKGQKAMQELEENRPFFDVGVAVVENLREKAVTADISAHVLLEQPQGVHFSFGGLCRSAVPVIRLILLPDDPRPGKALQERVGHRT